MHLHSKVPVISFLGLMHLRVSGAGCILIQARCLNDRGILNRAFRELQPLADTVFSIKAKILSVTKATLGLADQRLKSLSPIILTKFSFRRYDGNPPLG
jgi:hypothetical protein